MKLHVSWRLLLRVVVALVALAAIYYLGEEFSLRLPIPASRVVLSQIPVESYDAVRLKSGRTEFYFDAPRTVTCVNAELPHLGYAPCWYVRRHAEQRTDINPSGIKSVMPQ